MHFGYFPICASCILAFSDTHALVSTVYAVSAQDAKCPDIFYLYNKGDPQFQQQGIMSSWWPALFPQMTISASHRELDSGGME